MRTKMRNGTMYALIKRDGKKRWIAMHEVSDNERAQHLYRHGKPRKYSTTQPKRQI